jgi:hypothetical protein
MTKRNLRVQNTGAPSGITPARRRQAGELLNRMVSLDHAGDAPVAEFAREQLRAKARSMGMRLVSFTVTEESIPDPALEALPRADYQRVAAISRDMRRRPEKHAEELARLVKKYPRIPMLRNHLAGALEAAGQRDAAARVVAETAREFPTYFFAFCNHVMLLITAGRTDEARALVETGPRGPVFTLTDFDPTRDTFHISEAISHAAMVGRYMLATGRIEAAEVQLEILRQAAPQSPQYRSLAAAMGRTDDDLLALSAALLRMAAEHQQRGERRRKGEPAKNARKSARNPSRVTVTTPRKGAGAPKEKAAPDPKPSVEAGPYLFAADRA